ncbi:AraC-type DNA-binding protein [Belliella buryatensis]|uniref:AraC-type DNA-binding protein n=1 Tax=Belliella buryatensis TaxID=1500549 RepID=A0A239FA37_9BACT|nr:helix-turn-helix transcriptional regulator [Belliella buryatensis]SNS53665.1 AraC-type DNA-binding protein [Belliella buryatensis]
MIIKASLNEKYLLIKMGVSEESSNKRSQEVILMALHRFVHVEQRFLNQNFNLANLSIELGLSEEDVNLLFSEEFDLSFDAWLKKSRVEYLISFFYKYGGALSLQEYAKFTGYITIQSMLDDFKSEMGVDFPLPMINKLK